MSSLQNQTNVIPKVLYGQSEVSGSEVSMNISATGIILGGDLNTATPITATISQAGIITDNPTGFNILSSMNMNQNNITNVASIIQEGNDLNINTGASPLDINISAGSVLNLTGDSNLNLTSVNNGMIITASSGDIDLYASNGNITMSPNSAGGTTTIQGLLINTPMNVNGFSLDNCSSINSAGGLAITETAGGNININSSGGINMSAFNTSLNLNSSTDITTSSQGLQFDAGSYIGMTTSSGYISINSSNEINMTAQNNFINLTAGDYISLNSTSGGNISLNSTAEISLTPDSVVSINHPTLSKIQFNTGASSNPALIYQDDAEDLFITNNATQIVMENTYGGVEVKSGDYISLSCPYNINLTSTNVNINSPNVSLGDINGTNNGAKIVIDDTNNLITISANYGLLLEQGSIQYQTNYESSSQTISVSSAYANTYNGSSLTATLPSVSSSNLGSQYLITNTNATNLTVVSTGGQLIYSSNGPASATSRTLATGHSHIFTAIKTTGNTTYGWSKV